MARKIYVSLDVLVVPGERQWHVTPYARSFLTWAARQGRTTILTDRPVAEAAHLVQHLGCSQDVAIRSFEVSKAEHFTPGDHTYLVDDALIPGEASWFLEHSRPGNVVAVGYGKGVTPETKSRLEALFDDEP